MTVLALVLLLLAAAAPLLDRPLRPVFADPVLPVAAVAGGLLALAALAAAFTDEVDDWERGAAAVLGVLAAVTAGSHVVRSVFRLTRRQLWPGRTPHRTVYVHRGADEVDPVHHAQEHHEREPAEQPLDLEAAGSVLRGGAWIGYLERAAVAATLLAAFPEGLALVLAVKGVGRYPELRDASSGAAARGARADAPEEFIIGTLASLLWSAASAGTAALLR